MSQKKNKAKKTNKIRKFLIYFILAILLGITLYFQIYQKFININEDSIDFNELNIAQKNNIKPQKPNSAESIENKLSLVLNAKIPETEEDITFTQSQKKQPEQLEQLEQREQREQREQLQKQLIEIHNKITNLNIKINNLENKQKILKYSNLTKSSKIDNKLALMMLKLNRIEQKLTNGENFKQEILNLLQLSKDNPEIEKEIISFAKMNNYQLPIKSQINKNLLTISRNINKEYQSSKESKKPYAKIQANLAKLITIRKTSGQQLESDNPNNHLLTVQNSLDNNNFAQALTILEKIKHPYNKHLDKLNKDISLRAKANQHLSNIYNLIQNQIEILYLANK